MFVAINNTEMNIPQVTEWIMKERNANDGVISPEFAMEVLSKTNHFGHIKMILKNINDKCLDEDKKKYKEFVLACVDEREMSGEALESLRVMADICGVKEEFEATNKQPKLYNKQDCGGVTIRPSDEIELPADDDLKVYVDGEMFDDVAVVHLSEIDFSNVKELKFREGAQVRLYDIENMPENLDVSMCSRIVFDVCEFNNVKGLKFREKSVVWFEDVTNLPSDLDVSKCSLVNFCRSDFSRVKELKFGDGAEVCFNEITNVPLKLDVSMCSFVSMDSYDFRKSANLKFRDGAKVDLRFAQNLPEDLDFSMCSKVNLQWCNLRGVRELKFKNEEQKDEFLKDAKNFEGKIVYVGDEGKSKTMPVNNGGGMEM